MEINNCPFCGSENVIKMLSNYVKCRSCLASGPTGTAEQEAIAEWNKPGDRIKELEAMVAEVHQLVGRQNESRK